MYTYITHVGIQFKEWVCGSIRATFHIHNTHSSEHKVFMEQMCLHHSIYMFCVSSTDDHPTPEHPPFDILPHFAQWHPGWFSVTSMHISNHQLRYTHLFIVLVYHARMAAKDAPQNISARHKYPFATSSSSLTKRCPAMCNRLCEMCPCWLCSIGIYDHIKAFMSRQSNWPNNSFLYDWAI